MKTKSKNMNIIAVDPGREKCGLAVLEKSGEAINVLSQRVIATEALASAVNECALKHECKTLVIGNGTTSKTAQQTIKTACPALNIVVVDEYRTTDLAKKTYWVAHPPRGLKRLIPTTMLVPPEPVDDFVAVILGTRYLKSVSLNSTN